MAMKQFLVPFLMLLLAFPWSAITAGACPMRHAPKTEQSEQSHHPGCCCHNHADGSHQNSHHDQNGSSACNGNCCPVCHLVQDTPQAVDDIQTLPVYPKVAVPLPEYSAADFALCSNNTAIQASADYLHLKIPIPVHLRI